MANPDLLQLFVRRIHDAGLPYLVVGSVGSTFYGEPRLTMDADFERFRKAGLRVEMLIP